MTRTCVLGLSTIALLATACASGGAKTASEMWSETRPGNGTNAVPVSRWTCTPGTTAVDGLITDFSDKGGVPSTISTGVPPESAPGVILSQSIDAGRMVVEVNAAPGPKPQVLSVTDVLNGCLDARGYAGVQFSLSGALSGCSMTYANIDPAHQYYEVGGPYPPQKRIPADEVTSTPRTVTAPFQSSDIQGNPATPVDPAQLAAIQWLIIVPVAPDDGSAASPCTGKIVIDDIKLYR